MQRLVSMPAGCHASAGDGGSFRPYMGRLNIEAERRLPVHQAQRKRARTAVYRFNLERLQRHLRQAAPMEDGRGRHSRVRAAAAALERRQHQGIWEQPTGGELRCECARRLQRELDEMYARFPLLQRPGHFRPEHWDAHLPPVHYDRRDDCSPVCSGCGTVLSVVVMDHPFAGGNGDGDSPGAVVRTFDTLTSSAALCRTSPPYSRAVHFAEFMALWTLTGPRIPQDDMQQIVGSFRQWLARQQRPVHRRELLSCHLARAVLRPLSDEARRRYNERWLQIVARLWGEQRFRVEGPPLLPSDVAHEMKQRFVYFEQRWAVLVRDKHPITRGRKNIPFLPCVARQLLYQVCMHRQPPWYQQHQSWLAFLKANGNGDYYQLWEERLLRPWRRQEFWRLQWYCRYNKQQGPRLQNELRVALSMAQLVGEQPDRHILPWTAEYVALLHPADQQLRDTDPDKWRVAIQKCFSDLKANRSRSTSRARSKSVDCGPTSPDGFSRFTPGDLLQTPSWSPPTVAGAGTACPPSGTTTCRRSSPSTCCTDGLLEECVALLQRSCPNSAAPGSVCSSVPATVTDLLACARQWSGSAPKAHR